MLGRADAPNAGLLAPTWPSWLPDAGGRIFLGELHGETAWFAVDLSEREDPAATGPGRPGSFAELRSVGPLLPAR